ncbi:MAG TPA: outer membrane protein assembly factor BamD [Victivallales bacterium]|nr:outer membrane protein assembly factor BamD [Victivallales bacterium]HPO89566.1 outer membrane protein assembly factor BamD [Victivallales bacterium]HRR06335.1 outer membrane protein assembly factor BamD [Victivallales bacterium]HRR27898.1 outer membrane protein assembly factor BamD [Victivallales bacterium]HRU00663.1 outer membrane protein assembly factor BamD [Victivallales bacterium]
MLYSSKIRLKTFPGKFILAILIIFVKLNISIADDSAARLKFDEGLTEQKKSNYSAAGEKFMDAAFLADDRVLKINALKNAAECFKKAKSLYKEFTAIEKLLKNYPSEVDFNALVEREFEIGNLFYAGKREPAISWMPWIKNEDKSLEIYEAVKKNAPFAKFASKLKFRIGILYLEQNKIDEAIEAFEEINEYHKGAEEEKFAMFELANIYLKKASRGDSDGSWGKKARTTLRNIIKKYPDDKDILWAKQELKTADTLNAEKAFAIADFYRKRGNTDAAARYMNDIITEYPKTEIAEKALIKLNEMGKKYFEPPIKPEQFDYAEKKYKNLPMPQEKEKYIEVPSDSQGKWLLPIEDLELDKIRKDTDEKTLQN